MLTLPNAQATQELYQAMINAQLGDQGSRLHDITSGPDAGLEGACLLVPALCTLLRQEGLKCLDAVAHSLGEDANTVLARRSVVFPTRQLEQLMQASDSVPDPVASRHFRFKHGITGGSGMSQIL